MLNVRETSGALLVGTFVALWLFGALPIVGFLWLLFTGEFRWIVLAVAWLIASPFAIALVCLPMVGMVLPFVKHADGSPPQALPALRVAACLSAAYLPIVMTVISMGLLQWVMSRSTDDNWIPLLLTTCGAITVPWTKMGSSGNRDESDSALPMLTALTAATVAVAVYYSLMDSVEWSPLWWTFGIIMAIGAFAGLLLVILQTGHD